MIADAVVRTLEFLGLLNHDFITAGVFACERDYAVVAWLAEFWSVVTTALGVIAYVYFASHTSSVRASVMYALLCVSSVAAGFMHGTRSTYLGPLVQVPITIYCVLLLDSAVVAVSRYAAASVTVTTTTASRNRKSDDSSDLDSSWVGIVRGALAVMIVAAASKNGMLTDKTKFLPVVITAISLAALLMTPVMLVTAWRERGFSGLRRMMVIMGVEVVVHSLMFFMNSTTEEACGPWIRMGGVAVDAAHALEHLGDYFSNHMLITATQVLLIVSSPSAGNKDYRFTWYAGIFPVVQATTATAKSAPKEHVH